MFWSHFEVVSDGIKKFNDAHGLIFSDSFYAGLNELMIKK